MEQLDCDTSLHQCLFDEEGIVINCFLTDICTARLNGKEFLVAISSEGVFDSRLGRQKS